jgi:hypothetical protein
MTPNAVPNRKKNSQNVVAYDESQIDIRPIDVANPITLKSQLINKNTFVQGMSLQYSFLLGKAES